MTIDRRSFLELAGIMLAASQLGDCCLVKKPKPICPFDPRFSDPESMLAIDTHAHIFNATDLQISDFLRLVAVGQKSGIREVADYFGDLLQAFTWATAPDVGRERQKLAALKPAIMACDTATTVMTLDSLRRDKYDEAVAELRGAVEARLREESAHPSELAQPMESLSKSHQGFKQVLDLPESYEELFLERPEESLELEEFPERRTINSALKFIIEMLQYRFVSIYNYLEAYSDDSEIKIDLMTPAPVDYDWWLSGGRPTRSSLPEQMALMKDISILTNGRVHSLVPFDPYRQVVNDLGMESGFSPMDLVRQSIEQYGSVGIKIYPPMGFAPFGNEEIGDKDPKMWDRHWLTEVAKLDDFPSRLDRSLAQLYDYCAAHDVPVMGHSSRSNGPIKEFEDLASPEYWETAANSFRDVSFSFGHFGGVGSKNDSGPSDAEAFLRLMEKDQLAGSSRLRADASYFSKVLDEPTDLLGALVAVYTFGSSEPKPALDRLMYGADWKMLVAEARSGHYLSDFREVIKQLEADLPSGSGLSVKFFGQNAVDYLGLRRARKNRTRLEEFYDRNEVKAAPLWMTKVDEQL